MAWRSYCHAIKQSDRAVPLRVICFESVNVIKWNMLSSSLKGSRAAKHRSFLRWDLCISWGFKSRLSPLCGELHPSKTWREALLSQGSRLWVDMNRADTVTLLWNGDGVQVGAVCAGAAFVGRVRGSWIMHIFYLLCPLFWISILIELTALKMQEVLLCNSSLVLIVHVVVS